jgi:hypothetical protein
MSKQANSYRKVYPSRWDIRAEMNAREMSRGATVRVRVR